MDGSSTGRELGDTTEGQPSQRSRRVRESIEVGHSVTLSARVCLSRLSSVCARQTWCRGTAPWHSAVGMISGSLVPSFARRPVARWRCVLSGYNHSSAVAAPLVKFKVKESVTTMHRMQLPRRLTWPDLSHCSLVCASTNDGAPSPPLRLIGPQPTNHKNELPLDLRRRAEPGRRVASLLARLSGDALSS